MSVEQDHLNWQLKVNETITSIEKNIADIQKTRSDTKLSDKKIKWYEISLIFIVFGLGIALAKVFL